MTSVNRPHALPARQERSQRTVERLLDAAETILSRGELEDATVPRIARAADLAVGTVYRRFADKESLVRAVAERFLQRSRAAWQRQVAAGAVRPLPLADAAGLAVSALVHFYRENGRLLRNLRLFAVLHAEGFPRQLDSGLHEPLAALLAPPVAELGVTEPGSVVRRGLRVVTAVLRDQLLDDPALPRSEGLEEELTHVLLTCLGSSAPAADGPLAATDAATSWSP